MKKTALLLILLIATSWADTKQYKEKLQRTPNGPIVVQEPWSAPEGQGSAFEQGWNPGADSVIDGDFEKAFPLVDRPRYDACFTRLWKPEWSKLPAKQMFFTLGWTSGACMALSLKSAVTLVPEEPESPPPDLPLSFYPPMPVFPDRSREVDVWLPGQPRMHIEFHDTYWSITYTQ